MTSDNSAPSSSIARLLRFVRPTSLALRRGGFAPSARRLAFLPRELAERMKANRSLIVQQEKAEADDRITLKSLRAFANALDCDLVYAFVPRADTLQELVDARARAAAKANVLGVEHTMALENQASGNLEQAIEAEAERLTRKRKRT